ncbi:MAG TPA: M14 family metallopeptidase [Myxococcota bacterium]|nr:M14 family metallopeptidase [Myxococcota bacterium]
MTAALWLVAAWAQTAPLDAWLADHPPPEAAEDTYVYASDLFADLAARSADRPGVTVTSLGATTQGRPIWAWQVAATGEEERKVLIFAGIHALEWISTEVAAATLRALLDHPREHTSVTVVPLLNPDGRAKVEADLAADRARYRRGNAAGVDLNRDFAVNHDATSLWRRVLPGYHASSPAPLSQPETRALDALADRERFDRAASLHAFGGFFYFPWSGRWERPDDWGRFMALGRAMEEAQGVHAYRTRQLSRWGFFFRAQGSEIDHLYGRYGTLAFLVELTRSGIDPLHPADLRTPFRWYNPRDPEPTLRLGVAAMEALIDAP